MSQSPFRARIYIDGLNLYNNCLKNTGYKWLDLEKFCTNLLGPAYAVQKVYYFTARVADLNGDGAPTRQTFYLNAISKFPNIKIELGNFRRREKKIQVIPQLQVQIINPMNSQVLRVEKKSIIKGYAYEEKGTDVNLAIQLLIDAYTESNQYDCAVVISNDTDFEPAIKHVSKKIKKKIFVINTKLDSEPHGKLKLASDNPRSKHKNGVLRKIKEQHLQSSQLSDPFQGIAKPRKW